METILHHIATNKNTDRNSRQVLFYYIANQKKNNNKKPQGGRCLVYILTFSLLRYSHTYMYMHTHFTYIGNTLNLIAANPTMYM